MSEGLGVDDMKVYNLKIFYLVNFLSSKKFLD